jgi:hypothetical protein
MGAFEFRLEDKRFVVELYLHWVTFEGKGITFSGWNLKLLLQVSSAAT